MAGLLSELAAKTASTTLSASSATTGLLISSIAPTMIFAVVSASPITMSLGTLLMTSALALGSVALLSLMVLNAFAAHARHVQPDSPIAPATSVVTATVIAATPAPAPPQPAGDTIESVIAEAIALGFPDTSEAEMFTGRLILSQRTNEGMNDISFCGVHAHLPNGNWLVDLTYPRMVKDVAAVVAAKLEKFDAREERYGHRSAEQEQITWTIYTGSCLIPDTVPGGNEVVPCIGCAAEAIIQRFLIEGRDLVDLTAQERNRLLRKRRRENRRWSDALSGIGSAYASLSRAVVNPGNARMWEQSFQQHLWGRHGASQPLVTLVGYPYALMAPAMKPTTVDFLHFSLDHWFLYNVKGLPAPFTSLSAQRASTGFKTLYPAHDTTELFEQELSLANARPDQSGTWSATARRLATWRTLPGPLDQLTELYHQNHFIKAITSADPMALPVWEQWHGVRRWVCAVPMANSRARIYRS